jgi:NTE family protein
MPVNTEYFTQDASILSIVSDLEENGIKEKEFSDIISTDNGHTHQYVDLVQEGGGVLGVSLLGYTYILEKMNIRFLYLAGTSAGAINTILMAAAGPSEAAKTPWILEKMSQTNLFDFVDGDRDARNFIDALLNDAGNFKLAMKGIQVIDNFKNQFGLNPGDKFLQWMKAMLKECGIHNYADLRTLRMQPPKNGLFMRENRGGAQLPPERQSRVAIVAADINTESKVIFPEMAHLYWSDPEGVNPAEFVRASMSIPFFFHPYRVKNIPKGEAQWKEWVKHTGYRGNIPDEVMFMDGGTMSNFPIDLFHDYTKIPNAPTFGVKLGMDRSQANKNDKFFGLLGSLFNSSRHVHDYDFLCRNPEYRKLICMVDTGQHNWLNFSISDEEKKDLFIRGAKAAAHFLTGFDWKKYKEMREGLRKLYE